MTRKDTKNFMREVFIVEIKRTAVGKFGGALAQSRPDDLLAYLIAETLKLQPNLDPNAIEEVIIGAANQAGEDNRNVARMAALLSGLPISVTGVTVNRLCASGLQAIIEGSRAIATGDADLLIAGGVESMTRAPFVMAKAESAFSRKPEIYDTTIGWRFTNPKFHKSYPPISMGETAEEVAKRWRITRESQDQLAFDSQVKYAKAAAEGKFNSEIIGFPLKAEKSKETIIFAKDEHPRETTLDKLASLKPAFAENGTVTAGNSSGINDGAAICIMASYDTVKKYDLKPIARVVSNGIAGVDPSIMGIGPVEATRKALKKAGLKISDLSLIELNEAFAAQALACIKDLELNPATINVNGGSIAIGHPLGASGCRISATLIHEMQKNANHKYGLATMCVGVGQGVAVIYENLI